MGTAGAAVLVCGGCGGQEVAAGGAGGAGVGSGGAGTTTATTPDPVPLRTVTFEPDHATDVLNPERGWMRRGPAREFARFRGGDDEHPLGYSVVWTDVWTDPWSDDNDEGNPFRLDNYRTEMLPQALLDAVDATFAQARTDGVKLKVRFAYNYTRDGRDTTLSWMKTHVAQLGPVLTANADTMVSMDAGFVGLWGEMHSSTDIIDDVDDFDAANAATAEVVQAVLDATPSTLHIDVRYPRNVRSLFGDTGYVMDLDQRFTGTDQSRVGWYNDCLWSNEVNTGTYYPPQRDDRTRFELDRATFEAVGRYAATSGESCEVGGLNEFNSCAAVLADLELIGGPDHLYRGYWADMYQRWIDEGCYDEITRRLGYRLQLLSVTVPVAITAGRDFNITLEIQNTGYGKVYNPRPLDLVLVGPNREEMTVRLSEDARRDLPLAGQTTSTEYTAEAPRGLAPDTEYTLELRLPDPSPRLASDPRYTMRFVNVTHGDEEQSRVSTLSVAPR